MDPLGGSLNSRSSLPLQLLLWLDDHFSSLLVPMELLMLIGKPYFLQYPAGRSSWEFFMVLLHPLVQWIRSWLGTAGNKQERAPFLAGFLWLTNWTVLVTGYLWRRQAYALAFESWFAAACCGLAGIEALLGSLVAVSFCDGPKDAGHCVAAGASALASVMVVYWIF